MIVVGPKDSGKLEGIKQIKDCGETLGMLSYIWTWKESQST